MDLYLCPICDTEACVTWIEPIKATSLADASYRICKKVIEDYHIDDVDAEDDNVIDALIDYNIYIGTIYTLEDFG